MTLLTDFGLDDSYVGTVKGVLLGINPAVRLVDLTHSVPPQDILRGALASRRRIGSSRAARSTWRSWIPGSAEGGVRSP